MDCQEKREPLIEAVHLKKYFSLSRKRKLHAVDDVSFKLYKGETLGLVGESGCGKSTVGNIIMRLLTQTDGKLLFKGTNVFAAAGKGSREYCRKMQIIFQDPYSSLNPRKTIRGILREAYEIHAKEFAGENIEQKILTLCDTVNIAHNLLDHYPHELDGGMRQVVGIARALSLDPEFIVCDEPVSSLDVSIQARIINLLIDIQQKKNLSYLFVSHDLSVVRHISDRIAVMYLGQIVEMADTDELFINTLHPYSIALLSAVPRINLDKKVSRIVLKGDVPSPVDPKPGCRFAPRCWMACEECRSGVTPELEEVSPGHFVACPYARQSIERAKSAEKRSIDI